MKPQLIKKTVRDKAVSTKLTTEQNEKLVALAKKSGITKGNLMAQLIKIGYKEVTKHKTF